jgi:hypothetical protein
MRLHPATRPLAALAAGVALGDCVLLGTSLLLATAQAESALDRSPDRSRAWLRCVTQGGWLFAVGAARAANTVAVVLHLWPGMNTQPVLAAVVMLLLAFVGAPGPRRPALDGGWVALALAALLAPPLVGIPWTPCAFAAVAAGIALAEGAYRLGPLARRLAGGSPP